MLFYMLSNFNAFSKVIFEKSFHYLNNIMTDSNVIRNKNESTNLTSQKKLKDKTDKINFLLNNQGVIDK